MSEYEINTWLNPCVQAFERIWGKVEKPVIWEVGSRDGKDAVELARRIYAGQEMWFWSNAQITALECNPEQAEIIRENYPEMTVLEVAASNSKGSAPFVVYHGDEGAVGSSSLNLDWKEQDFGDNKHIITVETDCLENIIGDEQIDIMKIDVEGHSIAVIEGLGSKLRQVKVFHVETEKWTDSNIKMKPIMIAAGYQLVDETEEYGGMPDQVWVRQ